MLGFCRRHPRHDKEPGEILVQDPSRVGRPLDRSGSPDPTAYAAIASAFETVGWRFRFVTGTEPSQGLEAVHEALEEIAEAGSRRMRRRSVQPKGGAE